VVGLLLLWVHGSFVFLVFGHSIICQILILSLPSISYIRAWVHQMVIWLTTILTIMKVIIFFSKNLSFWFLHLQIYLYIFSILSFWVEIIVGTGMLCLNAMVVGFVFCICNVTIEGSSLYSYAFVLHLGVCFRCKILGL